MTAKSHDKAERKAFFARLPASTYRKLRMLAKSPVQKDDPGWNNQDRVGVMFRFTLTTHTKLLNLARRRPSNQQWASATMCETLADLIEEARISDLKTRDSMHDIVRQLIQNARLTA